MTGHNNRTGVSFDNQRSASPPANGYYDDKDDSGSIKRDNDVTIDIAPARRGTVHDDVWGDLDGDGPNYRGLGWCVEGRHSGD